MRPTPIYLLYPLAFAEWIQEVDGATCEDRNRDAWEIVPIPYDSQNGFDIRSVVVRVCNSKGPIVLIEPVRRDCREHLRERLRSYTVVKVCHATDATDIYEAITVARQEFDDGEPLLPRKFVVCVLVLRKLIHGNYWTGRDKGYLWARDVPKGRGIPEDLAFLVPEVVSDLENKGILKRKISQGRPKYALNPERKPEIHAMAERLQFADSRLLAILKKDVNEVSASLIVRAPVAADDSEHGLGVIP